MHEIARFTPSAMTPTTNVCPHSNLTLEPSVHASTAGFQWSSAQKRAAAVTSQGKVVSSSSNPSVIVPSPTSFPGPLVLPEDDLALDPKYPAQSLRAWVRLKERNKVTEQRKTIYVADPPEVNIDSIRSWSQPMKESVTPEPQTQEVIDYLAAFYHGIPVKKLPIKLAYTNWDTPSKSKSKNPRHIGLDIGTECVGIRTRASRDLFSQQLNLDDLLDAAISLLPDDAYALLLLVSHDIYENEEDDFACGRAYGGSRVAVVSTARYNPVLDIEQNVEREHAWPASHCEAYVQSCCTDSEAESSSTRKKRKIQKTVEHAVSGGASDLDDDRSGPVYAALAAQRALPSLKGSLSSNALSGLWLARVCRTASHELGHCFGMDHCVYYACAMQGTASLAEDARQPPYICPVDLAKVLQCSNTTAEARYKALLDFCERERLQDVHHFAAFAAWIRSTLESG